MVLSLNNRCGGSPVVTGLNWSRGRLGPLWFSPDSQARPAPPGFGARDAGRGGLEGGRVGGTNCCLESEG